MSLQLGIPALITPNGDGFDDVWEIKDIDQYPGCIVQVFNSFGSEVFYSKGYPKPWDAKSNNKTLPSGVYVYRIFIGSKAMIGRVMVAR